MASVPILSVVTRTRGRPLLLRRAALSVANAIPAGGEWIIVCDDPQPDPSLQHLRVGLSQDTKVRIVHTGGAGRAAALNAGLDAALGVFVHFHDDDDTVEPEFYRKTLALLDAKPHLGAAVTWVERREESVTDGVIRQLSAVPHNPGLRAITFARLASACIFPPIAFVARRDRALSTGPFDTQLDVAEDYDFFLRFLRHSDIGVLRERLCAVHVRRGGAEAGDMANSAASWDVEEVDAFYRNAQFRRDLERGEIGMGWLLAIGELARSTSKMETIFNQLRRMPFSDALRRLLR